MKKLLLCVALLTGGAIVTGCSNPCDELAKICAKCKDATTKDSCNSTVNTYKSTPTGDTGCQAILDAKTYATCDQ